MADKAAAKRSGKKNAEGAKPKRTRLIEPLDPIPQWQGSRPYTKEQQLGRKPSRAPKGGRR